jgi:hypothetical protein
LTLPVTVAPENPTLLEGPVEALGAGDGAGGVPVVVKLWSAPIAVPLPFIAMIRKWYVLPRARPLSVALTELVLVPDPAEVNVVSCP